MSKDRRNPFALRPSGIFRDTITVHTAPSGTQYVNPIDVLFPDAKAQEYIEEARKLKATRTRKTGH